MGKLESIIMGAVIGLAIVLLTAISYAMGEGIFYLFTGSVTSGLGAGALATLLGFITLSGVALTGAVVAK